MLICCNIHISLTYRVLYVCIDDSTCVPNMIRAIIRVYQIKMLSRPNAPRELQFPSLAPSFSCAVISYELDPATSAYIL
jgi:hypothetical protein